jgi:hypothetical protein
VTNKLFVVTSGTGHGEHLDIKKIDKAEVRKSDLKSTDVYILDVGEVFVWVGSKAAPEHKKGGMGEAQEYLRDNGLPNTTPIARVLEGAENEVFLSFLAGERKVPQYNLGPAKQWATVKGSTSLK